MKNTSLYCSIAALVIGVAALIVSLVSPKSTGSVVAAPESNGIAAGEIVYIQLDSLIMQYDMYSDLLEVFESKAQGVQDDLNKKGRQLESDMKSFENQINKGLLTRSNAETQQNALLQRQAELQNLAAQRQAELEEENAVLNNQVLDAILTYLESYNQTHQYASIINATSSVLVNDPSRDITKEIVDGLNAEYVKSRNSK